MGSVFIQKHRELLPGCGLLCLAAALLLWPSEVSHSVREGLGICGNVLIPSLFPFFVLSSLVVELGLAQYLGRLLQPVMGPLFRVNGCCAGALVLGWIGGYPVGARTAIALYESGQCGKTEAERLLAFCNNAGPAFILGVVGTGVFGSGRVGAALYLVHILASVLVGVVFRFYKPERAPRRVGSAIHIQAVPFPLALTRSVTSSAASLLNLCAFVLFFAVLLRCLVLSQLLPTLSGLLALLFSPLGVTQPGAQKLLTGVLELSSGVLSLTGDAPLPRSLALAAFLMGWAGLSVHCQVLSFLGDSGLSVRPYFCGKLLHGLLSALLSTLLLSKLSPDLTVGSYLAQQVETLAGLDFSTCLTTSCLCALGLWGLFLCLMACGGKKRSGKTRHLRV